MIDVAVFKAQVVCGSHREHAFCHDARAGSESIGFFHGVGLSGVEMSVLLKTIKPRVFKVVRQTKLTVSRIERPGDTASSFFHMTRLLAGSRPELGSSSSRTEGLPV